VPKRVRERSRPTPTAITRKRTKDRGKRPKNSVLPIFE
jgi:hypothetical protein